MARKMKVKSSFNGIARDADELHKQNEILERRLTNIRTQLYHWRNAMRLADFHLEPTPKSVVMLAQQNKLLKHNAEMQEALVRNHEQIESGLEMWHKRFAEGMGLIIAADRSAEYEAGEQRADGLEVEDGATKWMTPRQIARELLAENDACGM